MCVSLSNDECIADFSWFYVMNVQLLWDFFLKSSLLS